MLAHIFYKPDLIVSKENIQKMVGKGYRHIFLSPQLPDVF